MNAMTPARTAARIAIEGVRKARMSTPVREPEFEPEAPPDKGPTGQAALARPRAYEQVATGNKRQGREATDAVRYLDSDLWWHCRRSNVFTERQFDAGIQLTRLYQSGYSAMLALPSYGDRDGASSGSGGGIGSKEDKARSKARRDYNDLADKIPHTARHAMACMVRGEPPTMMLWASLLRSGCDAIADALDLPRN